jgi:hypothetical protein
MKKTANSADLRRPRRCVCGKCGSCVDNDRWDRIFQEKFGQQEQDYYAAGSEPRSAGVSANAFADASIYAYAEEGEISTKLTAADRFHNFLRKSRYSHTAA